MTEHLKHLLSTISLINRSFPDKIPDKSYLHILKAFYEHLSDRNLAIVIHEVTGHPIETIINDIYKSTSIPTANTDYQTTLTILVNNGFLDWAQED